MEIYAPNIAVCVTTRDISLSDLFAQTDAEIPAGSECAVSLLTEGEPKIEHKAVVVRLFSHSGKHGIGLVFTDQEDA